VKSSLATSKCLFAAMVRAGVLCFVVASIAADAKPPPKERRRTTVHQQGHLDTMRAGALVRMPTDGEVHFEDLQEVEVEVPGLCGATQVRVQVAGSSVNPVDWKLIKGDSAKQWSYPHVFGRDCSGTVLEVGSDVSRLKVGDAVWADNAHPEGCYGEFVLLEEAITGLAPTTVPLVEAALLPLVALTAKQAMNIGGLPEKAVSSILVLGGSGGVGHVALQIARAWAPEARIFTTCGTQNLMFCADMGADQVLDYHTDKWQDVVPAQSADIVFDAVGRPGTAEDAYKILKDGGSFVTIAGGLASDATAASRPLVKQEFFLVDSSDYRNLDTLKELVDAGQLRPVLDQTFSASEIASCFNYSMAGHSTGKVSVVPSHYGGDGLS